MLAGVCAAFAGYFGLDVTLVRVIWAVVSVLTGGAGVLANLAAWAIIPSEGPKSPIDENIVSKKRTPGQADGPARPIVGSGARFDPMTDSADIPAASSGF